MLTQRSRKLVMIAFIAVTVALVVIGFILLPEVIAVQIGAGGYVSNTMPKFLGLLIPLIIGVLFPALYYKTGEPKHLIGAAVGVIAAVLVLIFNL